MNDNECCKAWSKRKVREFFIRNSETVMQDIPISINFCPECGSKLNEDSYYICPLCGEPGIDYKTMDDPLGQTQGICQNVKCQIQTFYLEKFLKLKEKANAG